MTTNPTTLSLPPNVRLARGRHGTFFVMAADTYVGRSLLTYGEWTECEFDLMRPLLKPNDVVIDVGANIGSHTIALAKAVSGGGEVYAFEPQPKIFQLLAANVTINGLANVRLFPAGLSDKPGSFPFPDLNYRNENNFGAASLAAVSAAADAAATKGAIRSQPVPLLTLDDVYELPRLALIKIDVEGMELNVLRGAERVIRMLRPILYVENEFANRSEPLLRHLLACNYELYWHVASLFNERNFHGHAENIFSNIACINMLAIPRERKIEIRGLRKVNDPAEYPRRKRQA